LLLFVLLLSSSLFSQEIAKAIFNKTIISASGLEEGGVTTHTIHKIVVLQNNVQFNDLYSKDNPDKKIIFNANDTITFEYYVFVPYINVSENLDQELLKSEPVIIYKGKQINVLFKHFPGNDKITDYIVFQNDKTEEIQLHEKIIKEYLFP